MPAFKDILGQPHIKQEMQRAIAENRVSHAYMIAGEALTGKKFIAGVMAQTLLCEHPVQSGNGVHQGPEPCGECAACKKVLANAHPDLRIVTHEKDTNLSVEEIRNQLTDSCYLRPFTGDRKVYIVPDAELMADAAQNKLLKTLEEPPSYATIILLTTSREKMLPTIQSRCAVFSMQPVKDEVLRHYLTEVKKESSVSTEFAVRFAGGSAGRAVMLAQDKEFADRARHMIKVMTELQSMDVGRIHREMKDIFGSDCKDVRARKEFFHICRCYLRDIMLFRATSNSENLILRDQAEYISLVARHTSFLRLARANEALDVAGMRLASNVNATYTLQFFFMQMRSLLRTA